MRQRDQLGPRGEQRLERVEIDPAVLGQRAHVDAGAGPFGDHLPGHDIGMMLERGKHDPVALAEPGDAPARGDQIDRLGRPADEHHLVLAARADEIGDPPARGFVAERHLRAAAVDPAMDGGIIAAQRPRHGVDHGLRLLRRRRGVEIMPRAAVGGQQAGKIGPDVARVRKDSRLAHKYLSTLSSATAISRSRSSASSSATNASPRKAWTSSRRARSGERPRAAM